MINILEETKNHVIAIEIIGGYNNEDEKSLEILFEEKLDLGYEKVNILVKLDQLDLLKTSWKAAWHDGMYALKHIKYCGKIAIVGHSRLEAFGVKMDNALFGSKKKGRAEKYFDIKNIEDAFDFVNEK